MFEHVTLLLSFVYALALTHLLSSATDLILSRHRVRFSGLQAIWMFLALLVLFTNWLSFWSLSAIKHWTMPEIGLQFATAVVQYFTCSLVSMRVEGIDKEVNMAAFYTRQRPVMFLAFSALAVVAMIENYVDRNNLGGALSSTAWVGEDVLILPLLILFAISGIAKAAWVQWTAALLTLAVVLVFLASYVPT